MAVFGFKWVLNNLTFPSLDWWIRLWSASFCFFSLNALGEQFKLWYVPLCWSLSSTAPTPFSRHSMMEVGSSRSSGATNTCPIPSPCLSLEAMFTGRTGGRTLWREPISGRGKMSQSFRRRALSHLTCRSSIPAGNHKVRTVYFWLFCFGWDTHRKGPYITCCVLLNLTKRTP